MFFFYLNFYFFRAFCDSYVFGMFLPRQTLVSVSVCDMPWATGPAVHRWPLLGGREPAGSPHHKILLLLAGLSSRSSAGHSCSGTPPHDPLQRSGAVYQSANRAGLKERGASHRGKCKGADRHTREWLFKRTRRQCEHKSHHFQQHGLLLLVQPTCRLPQQQRHSKPADQPGCEGLSAWRGCHQRLSIPTRSGTDKHRRRWRNEIRRTDRGRRRETTTGSKQLKNKILVGLYNAIKRDLGARILEAA